MRAAAMSLRNRGDGFLIVVVLTRLSVNFKLAGPELSGQAWQLTEP
jgi:hypothetical protein